MMPRDDIEELQKMANTFLAEKLYWEVEAKKDKDNCKTLARKLLEAKPELEDWLKTRFGEYL